MILGHLLAVTISSPLFVQNLSAQSTPTPQKPLKGFSPDAAAAQFALEKRFDALLQRENLRTWMKRITAHPHHVGSPFGKEVAEFIADQFKTWGFQTEIEEFEVLFPTPKVRILEMISPEKFTAGLVEPPLAEDATSALTNEQLPSYNAYSIDGDVTGALVYVNYGLPRDYEILSERGIDVRGKIVIARYGGSWRGIKPKLAAEHGAIGCIIYSDPREDGYHEGDVYPKGAWRNEHGVERGSVADLPVSPGDPATPGIGATKDAKRLPLNEVTTLTQIPVLPISYGDALPLLRALGGPTCPESWRGALPLTYHMGPGPAVVHLKVEFDWRTVTARDVIARLPGAERPEQWIIRGNHHDAWVCGADDPVSGLVALLEEARVIGDLARAGWKPKRTLIFAAWDAEEPGLLGSTEWVETHADELREHAVAYINGDDNQRGFLRVGGSHSLEAFVGEIARDVMDPQHGISVADRARAQALAAAAPEARRALRDEALKIRALGSGSDYSPFLQHLGIACLDIRYGGEGDGGSYHSIYDSFDYYTRFGDPDFSYGIALAQTSGRAVLRLANADVLPFDFQDLSETVTRYLNEVIKLADDLREETAQNNKLIRDKTLKFAADSAIKTSIPPEKPPVPHFSFAPLRNALDKLQTEVNSFQEQFRRARVQGSGLSKEQGQQLDSIFRRAERTLTSADGLPRRPWYKHLVYAPGYYTGYGVKTLPGIREAIEQRQWEAVNEQIEVAAKAIQRLADLVSEAKLILPKGPSA